MTVDDGPSAPTTDPVAEFASSLRRLRLDAGNPTFESMERRSGRSRASLNGASKGRKFPTWDVTRDFVAACGGDLAEWRQRWQAARDALSHIPQHGDGKPSPYRGLEPYGRDDADLFFGRERLVARLTELTARARFTVVLGASGSGKSSLLRAGFIPRVRNTEGERPSVVRTLKPGATPLTGNRTRLRPSERPGDTLLVVDQFEELFTVCRDPAEREDFVEALLAAREPDSRLRVVVALRSDFFGRFTQHAGLAQAYQESHVLVGPMNREELREAVTKPVSVRGLNVQRTLTERAVSEVENDPAALPLMSYALDQAWRFRTGHLLDEKAYDAAGGLHGAIAQQAESTYAAFTPAQAAHACRVLLRLVTPGDDGPCTRRRVRHAELHASLDEEGIRETRTVVEALVAARLLILDEDDEVDLAHEALLTSWPRLRERVRDRLPSCVHDRRRERTGKHGPLKRRRTGSRLVWVRRRGTGTLLSGRAVCVRWPHGLVGVEGAGYGRGDRSAGGGPGPVPGGHGRAGAGHQDPGRASETAGVAADAAQYGGGGTAVVGAAGRHGGP
ncbi:nSTAND1 domain-containing NTPase [Streptomyces bacillaris]